jgi:hypothetical protein
VSRCKEADSRVAPSEEFSGLTHFINQTPYQNLSMIMDSKKPFFGVQGY